MAEVIGSDKRQKDSFEKKLELVPLLMTLGSTLSTYFLSTPKYVAK